MRIIILATLLLIGCKGSPTPERLKRHDAFLKNCEQDCVPRESAPYTNFFGDDFCECKEDIKK